MFPGNADHVVPDTQMVSFY